MNVRLAPKTDADEARVVEALEMLQRSEGWALYVEHVRVAERDAVNQLSTLSDPNLLLRESGRLKTLRDMVAWPSLYVASHQRKQDRARERAEQKSPAKE